MKTLCALAMAVLLLCASIPAYAGAVDSDAYVQAAIDTLGAYVMDGNMAPLEGVEIRQVERDILALKNPNLNSSIAERRKQLNDDVATLYAKDQWLMKQAIL
jgi:hypothetical protein